MIYVKYERYWNDYNRKIENKAFVSLNDLADWIFSQMQRDYSEPFAMSFPTPEKWRNSEDTPLISSNLNRDADVRPFGFI